MRSKRATTWPSCPPERARRASLLELSLRRPRKSPAGRRRYPHRSRSLHPNPSVSERSHLASVLQNARMMPLPIYNLVLAAGAGRRLAVLTGTTPKQFWRPDGQRSLLDDTLSRIFPVAPPGRTVTVVDRTHHPFVVSHVRPSTLGQVIYQPGDRG